MEYYFDQPWSDGLPAGSDIRAIARSGDSFFIATSAARREATLPETVLALVGVVLTEFVMWLERRMSRWRQLERERF